MEILFTHESAAAASEIFTELSDLGHYGDWMPVVQKATPVRGGITQPTWDVTLTGSVGKLRRSKRIRMARTEHVPNSLIVFERREEDQRTHSAWQLRVEISEADGVAASTGVAESEPLASVLVRLHYGGRLWEPLV
ncbi:MAG: SRPBCC family protein, partial [Acidimicrobiales bacterium]